MTFTFQDEDPNTTVRFPGQPEAVDIIVEVKRDRSNSPMTFRIAVKACFEEVTVSTTSGYLVPSTSTTSGYVGPSTSSGYVPSTSTSSGYVAPTSTSSGYVAPTSTSSGYVAPTSTSSGYVAPTSTSSGYVAPTSTSSGYVAPSTSSGTVCTMVEGMKDPQFIPAKNIRAENDKTPKDVDNLRPDSKTPFSVNGPKYLIKIWFMPEIPIESFKLINPKNVESMTVWYIKPSSRTSREVKVVTVSILVTSRNGTHFAYACDESLR
jgi:hypothetical protein